MDLYREIATKGHGYTTDGRLVSRDELVGGWVVTDAPGALVRFALLSDALAYTER